MRNKKNLLVKKENAEYTEYSAYMADGKLVYVERSLKNGTDELTEYIWAGSTLWAEKRTAGTESAVYYHHADYHGTTEVITDEAAVVVWKAGYDAYGNMLEATGVMEFEASFTGKMFDKDSGLYYFNARWYDSELGRFTTPDPARDGTNWVVYCAANPVGHWDPSGLESKFISWIKGLFSGDESEESDTDRSNQGSTTNVVTTNDKPVFGGNLPGGVLPIISSVPEGSGFLGKAGSFALQGLAGLYNLGANLVNNTAGVFSCINEGIDEVSQTLFGATTDEILMTMQACGLLIPTVQQINNLYNWISTPPGLGEESWLKPNGSPNFPPNNGAVLGTEQTVTIPAGTKLKRYGPIYPNSNFVTEAGASASELSLPPWTASSGEIWDITVLKELPNATQSIVAPWAGSEGGGIQYVLPDVLNSLREAGFIAF